MNIKPIFIGNITIVRIVMVERFSASELPNIHDAAPLVFVGLVKRGKV